MKNLNKKKKNFKLEFFFEIENEAKKSLWFFFFD